MWKQKLCLGTDFGIPVEEQIKLFHKVGFEAFFTAWSPESDIAGWKKLGDSLGMEYQSIHAPFGHAADLWESGEKADIAVQELIDCLHSCAENNVPIMVMHAFIGFDKHNPTEQGLKNFEKVVKAAEQLNVKIAVENTEGEEYLAAMLNWAKPYSNVGFCWDTGHEMCYNHSRDLLALYGDRLLCTHLNDNLGIKDFNGNITWIDDLHLLPFDGIADWTDITNRLNKHNYNGCLVFELSKSSKPDRHENDKYMQMDLEVYLTEAYNRACRVAALKARSAH